MKKKTITVRVYEIGDRFMYEKEIYILAYLEESRVVLVNIVTGHIWDHSVVVKDFDAITEREFELIIDCEHFFNHCDYLGNSRVRS